MTCRVCGCSESRPCAVDGVTCSWGINDPTMCDMCEATAIGLSGWIYAQFQNERGLAGLPQLVDAARALLANCAPLVELVDEGGLGRYLRQGDPG